MAEDYCFLIGAPKCGTSSLFNCLTLHPRVIGSQPKETFALLPNDHPLTDCRRYDGLAELERHFRSLQPGVETANECGPDVFLEGSTHNIYSESAAKNVADLRRTGTAVKVIAMLRNPARRVLSSFQFSQQNLAVIPASLTFADFVDHLLADRKHVLRSLITDPVSGPILANDLNNSDYARHLPRWFDAVGRENVRIEISEEWFSNVPEATRDIWNWLGLDEIDIADELFRRKNPTRPIGSLRLQRLARRLNDWLPSNSVKNWLKNAYFRAQGTIAVEPADHSQAIEKLSEFYQGSIENLEALVGRRLDVWTESDFSDRLRA